jgi:hypothetical protein
MVLSGCLINAPKEPNKVPSILKLEPKNLEKLPKGSIYQGWLVNGEFNERGIWVADDRSTWKSFGQFNWDDYSHVPTDVSGTAIENSFNPEVNIYDYDRIYITIESTKNTGLSSGIVILQGEVDQMNQDADLEHPISTDAISDFVDENWFYVFSQSDGPWYDVETVENGIWFGRVDTADVVWFDTQGVTFYCDVDTTDDEFWEECENIAPEQFDSVYYEYYGQDTLAVYLCLDADSVLQPCATSYDSLFYFEVVHVDTNGDTTVTPSLTTMPDAVDGWKYQAWITFTENSPRKDPLSLGRFSSPSGPDDDTSYSIKSGYDRHFNIPGEDFFQNVPEFGRLDIVESPYTYKLFITVEPDPDFDEDEPFLQLIMFSAYIPKPELFYNAITDLPVTLQWPLVLRDIGYDLNEGHRWPTMHIELERDLVVD